MQRAKRHRQGMGQPGLVYMFERACASMSASVGTSTGGTGKGTDTARGSFNVGGGSRWDAWRGFHSSFAASEDNGQQQHPNNNSKGGTLWGPGNETSLEKGERDKINRMLREEQEGRKHIDTYAACRRVYNMDSVPKPFIIQEEKDGE